MATSQSFLSKLVSIRKLVIHLKWIEYQWMTPRSLSFKDLRSLFHLTFILAVYYGWGQPCLISLKEFPPQLKSLSLAIDNYEP